MNNYTTRYVFNSYILNISNASNNGLVFSSLKFEKVIILTIFFCITNID